MHLSITVFFLISSVLVLGHITTAQGACSSKLENGLFEDLLNMMIKIKGKGNHNHGDGQRRMKIPAFAASLTTSKVLSNGEIVKFNKVWTNLMNGYNPNTGIFTAPMKGVYQFSSTVMTQHDKSLRVHLWKNDMKTVAAYPGTKGHNMGTLNIVLELKKDDRVYIKQGSGNKYIYSESGSNFSMFSGYLIA